MDGPKVSQPRRQKDLKQSESHELTHRVTVVTSSGYGMVRGWEGCTLVLFEMSQAMFKEWSSQKSKGEWSMVVKVSLFCLFLWGL